MCITFHVAALENKRHIVFFNVLSNLINSFFAIDSVQIFFQPSGIVTSRTRLCSNQEIICFWIPTNNAQETIVLNVRSRRESEFQLQIGKFSFRSFIDIEEFIIRSRHDFTLFCVNVKSSCFRSNFIPVPSLESISCKVERTDTTKLFLINVSIHSHVFNSRKHRIVLWCLILVWFQIDNLEYRVVYPAWNNIVLRNSNCSKLTTKLNISFKIEASIIYLNRRLCNVSMTMNLIHIVWCVFCKGIINNLSVRVVTNATNHLIGLNLSQVIRQTTKTAMRHQECSAIVREIGTLSKFAVKLSYLFLVHITAFKLPSRNKLKLFRLTWNIISPTPQPTLVIAFEENHVRIFCLFTNPVDNLNILNAPVNVVAKENIGFVLMNTAVNVNVIHQGSITTMNITDHMNLCVLRQVHWLIPDCIKFIGLNCFDSGRDLLCSKTSVHLINDLFWNSLYFWTLRISTLALFNREISHINNVHSVAILFRKRLITIDLCGLGVRCINDTKITVRHSML